MRDLDNNFEEIRKKNMQSMIGKGFYIRALSRENLSSGFVTRVDSNWPAQLQRLARVEILDLASIGIILSRHKNRFSYDEAHSELV